MIDIKLLLSNPQYFKEASKNKNVNADKIIEKIIVDYKKYLKLLQSEQLKKEYLNTSSKTIKSISNPVEKKKAIESTKQKILEFELGEQNLKILKEEIDSNLSWIPNPALEIVPIGKDETFNIIISEHHSELKQVSSLPHWEIINNKNMALFSEAVHLSGTRNIIYIDKGAKLVKAIEALMIEMHTKNNYKLLDTPVIVNKEILFNTAQLPKMEEDLYKLENGQYLIPTSETTLTNIVANKILKESDLPLNFVASTSCFRKEAGAAGRDTRGVIRLHQFRKVELVKIVKPENGLLELNNMIKDASSILDVLKIPYRIVQLVTGDISFGSQITYDLEVWMPSTQSYREISSISLMGDFQARRMKTKYRQEDGEKKFVNTLNGSGLAIDRTFAAILENYQNEQGDILIPDALQKYLDFKLI